MTKNYLTPIAIIVGAVTIAGALYAGLSERGRAPAANSPAPSAQSLITSPPPNRAALSRASIAKLQAELEAALSAEKRSRWIPNCWQPALARTKLPAKSSYSFQIAVDAAGNEISRGISEIREQDSRADVAECLRRQPIGLKASAIGASATLTFAVSFP